MMLLSGLAPIVGLQSRLGAADDPAWYVKHADWQQTLLAARQSLAALEQKQGITQRYPTFISPVVRGGEPAQEVRLSVSGVQELYLYVTGAPDVIGGAANWADAKLIDKDERPTWLGETQSLEVIEGRFSIDSTLESGVSGPLKIAGRQFEHGLHVYAYSKVRVCLRRQV